MAWTTRGIALLGLAALLALAGCASIKGGPMSDAELLLGAKAHNFRFKMSVASVQAHLYRGPWGSGGEYGAVPGNWFNCGEDEYQFALTRMGPSDVTPLVTPEVLAARLRVDGWREIQIHLYPGISDDIVVTAQNPSAAVVRLYVTYYDDPQGVSVAADSSCRPGDAWDILELMVDERGELPVYPATELPGDVPLFEVPR